MYEDFFNQLKKGIIFEKNNRSFNLRSVFSYDIKAEKQDIGDLVANNIYQINRENNSGYVKKIGDHYLIGDKTIFLIEDININKNIGVSGVVQHPAQKVIEFAVIALNEEYRKKYYRFGDILTDLRILKGEEIEAHTAFVKASGYYGVKHFLRNDFKTPMLHEIDITKYRELLKNIGYKVDDRLVYNISDAEFYKDRPRPSRIGKEEDEISIMLSELTDDEMPFFVKDLNSDVYQKLYEELTSLLSLKNERI